MHRNYYDHEANEIGYMRYISNIAYRYKFDVIYEDYRVLKIENRIESVITTVDETPRNTLCWKAWIKLSKEYGYCGIWKDRD